MATFVFNPTYYTISGATGSKATVKVTSGSTSYSFDVPLRNGGAKVYLSSIFKLFFTDPENTRTKTATLYVNNVSKQTYSLVYGSIDPEQVADMSKKRYVRWFDNFPMVYNFFNGSGFVNLSSLATNAYVQLHDKNTEGIFLKWIDCMGQTFSFLFVEGAHTFKVDGGRTQPVEFTHSGYTMEFDRSVNRTSGHSITCAACNLTKEERRYVKTVLKSMYCYMYVNSEWIPVSVESASTKYKQKNDLIDLEITIRIPDAQPQQL